MSLAVCLISNKIPVQFEILDMILAELGVPQPPSAKQIALTVSPDELSGKYVGLRGVEIDIELEGSTVCLIMQPEGLRAVRFFGTINDDNSFSIDNRNPSIALGFFPDPHDGCPSLGFGKFALRKA